MADDAGDPGGAGDPGSAAPPGDLAEETRRIVGAVQDWMRRAVPAEHNGPECQWCPLCQLANVLRGERPEVADKLSEAGLAIAGALKAVVDAALAHAPEPAAPPVPEPAAPPVPPRRRPTPGGRLANPATPANPGRPTGSAAPGRPA